jgi:outer membrane protein TolC
MKRGRSAPLVVLAAAMASRYALGQTAAPPAATAPSAAPATTAPAAAPLPATAVPDLPPSPTVSDPMLPPIAPPRRFIASWEEASRLLRARSTDLRRAHDDVLRAEAASRTALAAVLPSLNASGTATHTILPKAGGSNIVDPTGNTLLSTNSNGGSSDSLAASVRASLTLVNVQSWHAIGTAHVNEDQAHLSYEDLERTTAASLATAIAQNVTAERLSELGRLGLRNALERLALTEAKARTGSATGLDIVRARQDVANARSSLVTSDETLRQSRETLGLAVGLTEPVGVTPATDLSTIGQGVLRQCRALPDLEQRPDVLAAGKAVEIARRQRTEVDQGFLPTLGLASTLGTTVTDSGSPARTTWNVQAVLNVPIWDGGARYGARRNAAAIADQSAASLEALRRNSNVALVQARRSVEVAEESRRVAQEARDLALEVDRMTRLAYQTGKGTSLDLVTSAAALRQAEATLALQELALVQARINSLLTLANCSVAK